MKMRFETLDGRTHTTAQEALKHEGSLFSPCKACGGFALYTFSEPNKEYSGCVKLECNGCRTFVICEGKDHEANLENMTKAAFARWELLMECGNV